MQSLLSYLSELFGNAFEAAGLDRSFGEVVVSQRPDLGQFQCNGALPAAKAAKQNPRAVAQSVVDTVQPRDIFTDLSLAGPGFINVTLTDDFLAARAGELAADTERLGCAPIQKPRSVVIDFGGPNVAKAMHVGHLRSSIIGDSLQRVFRFAGDRVTSDAHLGDWGTQMGMLITELRREQPDLVYFDAAYTGPYPEESPISIEYLDALYPRASGRSKEDPEAAAAARAATAELQQGRPGYFALWKHFVTISKAALQRDFANLGVYFDFWLGESDAQPRIPAMLARLDADGFLEESDGAKVIRLSDPEEKNAMPPLIMVKSDGGVMYGTTDLATIEQRLDEFHAELILYVVDARQSAHFRQVFTAAKLTGMSGNVELEHIGFGTMNGADGKPFKTRAGGVMKLQDLLSMATEQALSRMNEAQIAEDYSEAERMDIARKVGIAAVKYADLMNHRATDYIFDLEKFVRFEGRTGAYLLYAAVRIKSILRKAAEQNFEPGAIVITGAEERELVLMLQQFPEVLAATYNNRAPNHLCEYIFTLAQVFSRFYQNCRIIGEQDEAVRASRLALAGLCLRMFERVLELLGMEIPERM